MTTELSLKNILSENGYVPINEKPVYWPFLYFLSDNYQTKDVLEKVYHWMKSNGTGKWTMSVLSAYALTADVPNIKNKAYAYIIYVFFEDTNDMLLFQLANPLESFLN